MRKASPCRAIVRDVAITAVEPKTHMLRQNRQFVAAELRWLGDQVEALSDLEVWLRLELIEEAVKGIRKAVEGDVLEGSALALMRNLYSKEHQAGENPGS